MKIYWSMRSLSEFRKLTGKECQQVLWQVGLKPFRHWQVWVAALVTSMMLLLGFETIFGLFVIDHMFGLDNIEGFDKYQDVFLLLAVASVVLGSGTIYRHFYFKILHSYIGQASLTPAEGWFKSNVKGAVIGSVSLMLVITGALSIDWAINSFDQELDPQIATINSWPEPVPDSENGFFAMVGMHAPVGASPFEAGHAWVIAVNEVNRNPGTAKEFPKLPEGLKYVAYVLNNKPSDRVTPAKLNRSETFCEAVSEPCWEKIKTEYSEVSAWLLHNKEILARYQALKKYSRWQYSIRLPFPNTPIPSYIHMVRGQSLLQASAMLLIKKGQVKEALALIKDDIRFVRHLLAEKDSLIGKMISSAMLGKDLAWLVQTLQEHPQELKPYWSQIAQMVAPLTPQQVSLVNSFMFMEQTQLLIFNSYDFEKDYGMLSLRDINEKNDLWLSVQNGWFLHHFRRNASSNRAHELWQNAAKLAEITDINHTVPLKSYDEFGTRNEFYGGGWLSRYFNQFGYFFAVHVENPMHLVDYYANRLFDVNALNTLIRLKLALLENGVSDDEIPTYLNDSNRSLWNPETGKPFEWDAQHRKIYFTPASDYFIKWIYNGNVPGRVGVSAM